MEYYAKQVVDAAYSVYKELGPGLLKSFYSSMLHKYYRI
jgi:hemoglobin-like flavoprotein